MRWAVALCFVGCSFETTLDPPRPDVPPPNVDTDGDGLLDADDNCPAIANPMQRDWDLDKHGDECDGCPHLASTPDPDGDGDRVGDACDPRPATAGDQRLYWLGFYDAAEIMTWSKPSGTWAITSGKLSQGNNSLSFLDSPERHGDVYFATSIGVVNPASYEIGFCGGEIASGQQYYCCAVTNNPSPIARAVSGWVGQSQISTPMAFPGTLDIGSQVDIVGMMSATASSCTFTQGTTVMVTSSTSRGPQIPGSASFYTATRAEYRYAFVVSVGS